MTRSELAELIVDHVWRHHQVHTPIDRKYVGKLEAGEVRWPNARYRQALREILGVRTDEELGFWSANTARAAVRLDRRSMVGGAAVMVGGLLLGPGRDPVPDSGTGFDTSVAARLAAFVHQLRQADDVAPAGSLVAASAGLLASVEQFASASGRRQVEVQRVAAEAAMLHWWLVVDAGGPGRTEWDRAVGWAQTARYSPLVGHLFGWRGGLALKHGRLREAVDLTRQARDPRWGVSPGGMAWAADYEARAHRQLGDRESLRRAADESQAAYERVVPEYEPIWLYWLVNPVLELSAADVGLLRDGPDAAPAMEAVLHRLPPERTRDASWYRAHLAEARARAGDVEGATRDAVEAARLSAVSGTRWTLTELEQLAREPHLRPVREALAA